MTASLLIVIAQVANQDLYQRETDVKKEKNWNIATPFGYYHHNNDVFRTSRN
jgi:hypothetical protein